MLLRNHAPVAVCLDTCHTHVAGYDIVSDEGYEDTMTQIEATVGLTRCACGTATTPRRSEDRSWTGIEHIGEGTIGSKPFRRLLHDERFSHSAFIAETPVDEEGDEERNVQVLKRLAK